MFVVVHDEEVVVFVVVVVKSTIGRRTGPRLEHIWSKVVEPETQLKMEKWNSGCFQADSLLFRQIKAM